MKKVFKVSIVIVFSILFLLLSVYLYLTDFGYRDLLTGAPLKAKHELPITYSIDWWAYQDSLAIDRLDVNIKESNLNIFNSTSLISYQIIGRISFFHSLLMVKEVHISERINNDTTLNCDRIIELTPIVESIGDRDEGKHDILNFNIQNEHLIKSNHWGINRIKFICGDKEQIIELRQTK